MPAPLSHQLRSIDEAHVCSFCRRDPEHGALCLGLTSAAAIAGVAHANAPTVTKGQVRANLLTIGDLTNPLDQWDTVPRFGHNRLCHERLGGCHLGNRPGLTRSELGYFSIGLASDLTDRWPRSCILRDFGCVRGADSR